MRSAGRARGAIGRYVAAFCFVLSLVTPLARVGDAQAGELACSGTNIVVSAANARDAAIACDGAADAVRFLGGQGLDASQRVELHVVAALPSFVRPSATGCYRHAERRVYVLTFGEFRKHGRFAGLPVDRVLHRSLITHEVAHAIAACNFAIPRPTLTAQEYLAYVAMFATMPEPHRARALAAFPGEGYREEAAINLTIYQMNPDYFGVQAYRHFLAPGNGTSFVHRVLYGIALASEGPL